MKIGEWEEPGRARGLLQRQLGELGATEYAAHVAVADNGRQRILLATDVGLLDYSWAPSGPDEAWFLRGQLHRWPSVRGLRLQTDAQLDPKTGEARSIWRLVAEDPKIELAADSVSGGREGVAALLAFAKACMENAG